MLYLGVNICNQPAVDDPNDNPVNSDNPVSSDNLHTLTNAPSPDYSEGGSAMGGSAMNGEVPSVPITTLAGLASLTHCKYPSLSSVITTLNIIISSPSMAS